MNPLNFHGLYIPDGEAHVMPDGRLYVYGSLDIPRDNRYCSASYHVLSTDDPSLERWVDHGVSFKADGDFFKDEYKNALLYAPDAVERDGKYYLYFCTSSNGEGVAVSDKPYGPFENAVKLEYANGDGIDPAVFRDDDGQCYYYWGQFSLNGARLNSDMRSLDMSTVKHGIVTEQEHGFHEGASMRKRGDKYYLLYTDITRGRATCISYAVSSSPLGPFERRGVIVDNIYCDPKTWNNHGSMECFNGQWYIFYHRSSFNSEVSRRLCAEKIYFDENGDIAEVLQSSNGASAPLCAGVELAADGACRMMGDCYLVTEGDNLILRLGDAPKYRPCFAEFKYVDLSRCGKLYFELHGHGNAEVYTNGSRKLASFKIDSDTFKKYEIDVCSDNEKSSVWLKFWGGEAFLSRMGLR